MNSLTFRFYYIFASGWRRRYVIVIPLLILPILGLIVGISSPKKYEAHTSMLIQETAKMNPFLEDFAVSTMLKDRMGALKTLLHSRHILGVVAKKLQLIDDQTPAAEYDRIVSELSSSLSVQMTGKDLIRIDFKSHSPSHIKETLKVISEQFVEQLLAPERSSMTDSSFFLAEHIESRREELDLSERALAKFKDEHANELPELYIANISRLAQLKQKFSERQAELSGAKRRLGGLDQQLTNTNPIVGRIEENIIKIRSELSLLRARYTDSHSKVKAALRNLYRLEEERRTLLKTTGTTLDTDQLWDIAHSAGGLQSSDLQPLLISQLQKLQEVRSNVDGLTEEVTSLQSMITDLEKLTARVGEHERQLAALERDQNVKRDLYEELLKRHEMARVTGSLGRFEQEKRIKIIDRPYTPTNPTNLPLMIFVIAGCIGGLALGISLAIVFELSDSSIRYISQLEPLTGVPVLSRIPALATKKPRRFRALKKT